MRWLRGKHPPEPSDWQARVRDAKKRVARWARSRPKTRNEESIFADLWTTHKVTFSRVQKSKCGYCELKIDADANGGDIEHYRPKALICKLFDDPNTWGREIDGHNSRDPSATRKTQPLCRGYFWLAYEWRNYLLACGTCNQKWKGNLFPVEGGHGAAPTARSAKAERPLLLNPYGDIDPGRHLEFDKNGVVTPRNNSAVGLETIRTCCLTRESLRSGRERSAKQACLLIRCIARELARNAWNEKRLRCVIRDLVRLGAPSQPHSGMVRILWKQQNVFGFTWKQLVELRTTLRKGPTIGH